MDGGRDLLTEEEVLMAGVAQQAPQSTATQGSGGGWHYHNSEQPARRQLSGRAQSPGAT